MFLEMLDNEKTISLRKAEVEDNQIRLFFKCRVHAGVFVDREASIEAAIFEAHLHSLAYIRIVIDNENFPVTHLPPFSTRFPRSSLLELQLTLSPEKYPPTRWRFVRSLEEA